MPVNEQRNDRRPSPLHGRCPAANVRQRGTALLMVIGVLALLAIVAVAYTTIGRADRFTSAVSIVAQREDDQSSFYADYFAQIISDDVLSVSPVRTGQSPPGNPADILYQREAFDYPSTDPQMVSDSTRLTNGTYRFNPQGTVIGPWVGGVDRRIPSDPWLASLKPFALFRENDSVPTQPAYRQFVRRVTALNISNTSPDGRFISLHNLRNRHSAPSTALSTGLALTNVNGQPINSKYDGQTPELWRPADWSNNLLGAHRPMIDAYEPSDPRHVNNQWCDTDGDGFADGRWQELIDSWDVNNPVNLLARNGRMRIVYAAKIVDLSGLVNVNTASDFAYSPGYIPPSLSGNAPAALRLVPAGLTPAEIDLRRLLMMGDPFFELGAGYNLIPQPTPATLSGNYARYDLRSAVEVGSAAYAALQLSREAGIRLQADDAVGGMGDYADALVINPSRENFNRFNPNPLEPATKRSRYAGLGHDPDSPATAGDTSYFLSSAPFGIESELDLRAFNGVNDDTNLSALEIATGGRAAPTGQLARFDPLRSNRPRADELAQRSDSSGNIGASDQSRLLGLIDIRSLITTISRGRPLVSRIMSDAQRNALNPGEVAPDLQALKTILRRVDGTNVVSIGSLGTVYPDAAASLFSAAATALAPYHNPDFFTDSWDPTDQEQRTLAYGHRGAEFALRAAAHWTANAIDAMDVDRETIGLGAGNVVIGTDAHAPIAIRFDLQRDLSFSENNTPFEAKDLHITLNSGYDMTNSNVRAPSFMAYGIEPQPFVIEMSYYVMFTDARDAAEGSTPDEGDPRSGSGIPGDVPMTEPIQISRKREYSNGDYLGEVIAFQITNPFEYDIKLTGPAGQPLFYTEHARRYYALTELDPSGSEVVPAEIELDAGQTRVFYAISPRTIEQLAARFENALQSTVTSDEVKQMMTAQFGSDAVLMPMIDPGPLGRGQIVFTDPAEQGTLAGVNMEMQDFMGVTSQGGGVALDGQRSVVNLWRIKRAGTNLTSRASDILVDRLRDPDGNGWWYGMVDGLSLASEDVDGTMSIEERTTFDGTSGNDNSGFSVTLWRAVRRPTDRTDQSVVKTGSLPPWCIEAKRDSDYPGLSLNQADEGEGGDPNDPVGERDEFVDEEGSRFTTLRSMIDALKSSSSKFNKQIDRDAEDKRDNPIPLSQSVDPATSQRRPYDRVSMQLHFIGDDLVTVGSNSTRLGRNPMLFSRPADTLMIPAIGPCFDLGMYQAGGGEARGVELGWLTLSEAAALASDYFTPSLGVYDGTSAIQFYSKLGHEDPTASEVPLLNRGAFVLDNYSPYLNLDGLVGYDGQNDQLMGAGVPLALNMLDAFRTADYQRGVAYGGLTQSVDGRLNINTMPVNNARLVPMLAPDPNAAVAGMPWTRLVEADDPNASDMPIYDPTMNADTFDIAAAIVAWRDKVDAVTRPEQFGAMGRRLEFAEDANLLADPTQWRARQDRALINGLHETPGFRSLGALGAVRIRSDRSGDPDPQNSIDRFGLDGQPLKHAGLSISSWPKALAAPNTESGNNMTSRDPDEVVDGVDEQLAILNAALPSLSVRSDVFCVWFVLQGYLPGDVVDLADDEPMVPTLRRRYMMIVDRSNVTTFGERPRVLLFKELPMD